MGIGLFTSYIFYTKSYGIIPSISWLCAVILPIILLYILFLFRAMGAADIKLFSIISGYFGFGFFIQSFVLSIIFGSVLSSIKLLKYHNLRERLNYLKEFIIQYFYTKKIIKYYIPERDGRECTIHMTIPIGISCFCLLTENVFYVIGGIL